MPTSGSPCRPYEHRGGLMTDCWISHVGHAKIVIFWWNGRRTLSVTWFETSGYISLYARYVSELIMSQPWYPSIWATRASEGDRPFLNKLVSSWWFLPLTRRQMVPFQIGMGQLLLPPPCCLLPTACYLTSRHPKCISLYVVRWLSTSGDVVYVDYWGSCGIMWMHGPNNR